MFELVRRSILKGEKAIIHIHTSADLIDVDPREWTQCQTDERVEIWNRNQKMKNWEIQLETSANPCSTLCSAYTSLNLQSTFCSP